MVDVFSDVGEPDEKQSDPSTGPIPFLPPSTMPAETDSLDSWAEYVKKLKRTRDAMTQQNFCLKEEIKQVTGKTREKQGKITDILEEASGRIVEKAIEQSLKQGGNMKRYLQELAKSNKITC